jgi:hypothetical protein
MLCNELENVIAQQGLEPLPAQAREHVVACSSCRAFVSDLTAIVSIANKMPAEIEPPARIWTSLRSQLEAEGLIQVSLQSPAATDAASWFSGWRDLFHSRVPATATVGLLIVFAAILVLNPRVGPRNTTASIPDLTQTRDHSTPQNDSSIVATGKTLTQQEHVVQGMVLAGDSPVDVSLTENLKKVDEFIGECERRLKEEPRDELARQYLDEAYQQKAELLAAMMDRGRSVN